MWITHPFFKYITAILLILISLFFLGKLDLIAPIKTVISTLFYPILIAGFLYYIIKPFVRLLTRFRYIPKSAAILIVYAGIAGALYLSYWLLADTIQKQLSNIRGNLPGDLKETIKQTKNTIEQNDLGMVSIGNIRQKLTSFSGEILQTIGDNLLQIVTTITGIATVLLVVPFALFYFLKDDHRLIPFMLNFIPKKHEGEGKKILQNIDETLAAYIIGQLTVAIVDGLLMYIGYLIIGLDYALVLAIFVSMTAVVPFFGPIIGILPAIVVAFTQDPMMVVYVVITLAIVQQLEGNLVAPWVLGNQLSVHPLTIILLLIVAASLYGFIGMVIAIPLYSVLKVTIKNFYHFYQLRHKT